LSPTTSPILVEGNDMQKTRRVARLLPAGLAAVAVAGAMIATAVFTGNDQPAAASGETPVGAAIPATGSQQAAQPAKKGPKATRYAFQNTRPTVGTLAAGAEAKVGPGLYFTTRGTKWALIERIPGQPGIEPFGWRRTVGDPNLGDPSSPGIQAADGVVSSVFKNPAAATVVYTQGHKAWYGKVYRLAGIPGWVESSAKVSLAPPAASGYDPMAVTVFVYDASGKLLSKFGSAKADPLGK
jgi:hypothetical protein